MTDAEARFRERLRRKLAVVSTLDGDAVMVAHVDELPPCIGERMRDILAERAIATLADNVDDVQ